MNVELSQTELEIIRRLLAEESSRLRQKLNDLDVVADCDPILQKMDRHITCHLGHISSLRVKITTLAYEASHTDEENLLEGDEENE